MLRRGGAERLAGERGPRATGAVVGQEVADAFELIWPTGEIDEQFLGGTLSEMPPPDARFDGVTSVFDRRPVPDPAAVAMDAPDVRLRPLTAPPDIAAAGPASVSDDVVRAIQRALAAIGSDRVAVRDFVVEEPAGLPRLPDRAAVAAAFGTAVFTATDGNRTATRSRSDPSDARRSALKRLIGGLRRR